MSDVHVFFFRGMSTTGTENAGVSFLDFGPMHRRLEKEFERRGIHFHPVMGMGKGSFAEMAANARRFLAQHPVWQNPRQPVHVFGHSAGGLVSRLVLEAPDIRPDKVLSYVSVATPHQGAQLARICIDMREQHRRSYVAMRMAGFNLSKHGLFFKQFTAPEVGRVFQGKSAASLRVGRTASIICAAPRAEWCAPLRSFHILEAFRDFADSSDGMIERDTQPFGEVLAELKVDHFRQLGFFGQRRRFVELCNVLQEFFVTTQAQ